jgi:ABC-type uncharacterized transport system permease subunit
MPTLFSYLAPAAYAASLALYIRCVAGNRRSAGRAATAFLVVGLATHYYTLLQRSRAVEAVPYQDLYGSMSLFAWLLAITYLGMERFHRQRSVAPFVLPFVILLDLLAVVLTPSPPPPHPPARGPLFALHVTSNILAYAAFALSFVLGVIYLAQNHILRGRKPGVVIWQFPALEVLERMMRSCVAVGLGALLFGTALGMVWLHRLKGSYFTGDPKEMASLLIFAVYAGYLWLSVATEWRGPRASALCVASFLVVIFSYTVVNIFLSGFHRYF